MGWKMQQTRQFKLFMCGATLYAGVSHTTPQYGFLYEYVERGQFKVRRATHVT